MRCHQEKNSQISMIEDENSLKIPNIIGSMGTRLGEVWFLDLFEPNKKQNV
jgi:hypothetical protein